MLSSDKNEIKVLKRSANLSFTNKKVYTLDKEPTGIFLSEKNVVGIDPGKSSASLINICITTQQSLYLEVRDLISGVRSSDSMKTFSVSNKT